MSPLEPGYFAPLGSHSRERSSAAKPCPVFSAPLPLWPAASTRCPRAPSPSRPAAWHVSRPNVLLFPDPRHEHPGLDLSTRPPRSDADLPLRRPPAADPNAPPKVAYPWLDPSNPGNWKEEHVSKPGPRPPRPPRYFGDRAVSRLGFRPAWPELTLSSLSFSQLVFTILGAWGVVIMGAKSAFS